MSAPNLSIVLPVYNQEDHIRGVVEGYTTMLDRLGGTYELMLVTNGCRDNSVAICQELTADHEGVKTIDLGAQGGWGKAVRAGLREVTGETIGYTNTARTSPEILALCASYSRAFPNVVVKANRKIRDNWRRRAGSLVYNLEVRALFDLPVWDINGTPKIFPRSFARLLDLEREDDLIDAEFNVICRREGYPIVEVPVLSTQRHGGTSTTNYASGVRMYRGALELRRRYGKMP
ncbi:glycosyltransferase [Solirubrobacter sp. CPCC 204708]|uniref:Glycosyltransferase n=1 Tax=Solirubrobacter deserti TaxID=2282478 RepID=A0ABT4RNC0_9ACTN|nr:glycosyltransferase [Solirubrobacter deserti]MBE2317429.1 glycosyltransferase [Solirubrobacter deserti]MDA0140011.1 glycosyltransferase [Solirubrobacter deserti]